MGAGTANAQGFHCDVLRRLGKRQLYAKGDVVVWLLFRICLALIGSFVLSVEVW